MTTYIHVNQHVIRKNKKDGTNEPTITVKRGRKNVYCHRALITGPSQVIYSADKPILSCGARVVIATESPVEAYTLLDASTNEYTLLAKV